MGDPLRVLHVVVNMNRGGAETLIMNLYRNIDRLKIQFDFLTCKDGEFDSEIRELGGEIFRIPYVTDVGHFKYVRELKRFFTENSKYKIVHSHLDKMSGLVMNAAMKSGIPVRIAHSHNTRSEGGAAARTYKWFAGKYILPTTTNLAACSTEAAKWLFKQEYSSSLILKNGIDTDRFQFSNQIREEVRNELKLDSSTFVLGHVGRFNQQKNHSFLLGIFKKFNSLIEDSVLILVGDGNLQHEIEEKIKKLGIEKKVLLLGVRSDINRILQAFDLFVFPSLHEGLPVSLIEAQGTGVPCLISNQISKEVDLGLNLIEYAPLSNMEYWVEKINNIKLLRRQRDFSPEIIKKSGFDIRSTADFITDYYSSILR